MYTSFLAVMFLQGDIVEQLKARGDTVFVFDSTQRHDDVECFPGDICVPGQISNAIQETGATCIIHTISPLSIRNRDNLSILHRVNVEGTRNVIEAAIAAGVRKLVYHSSSGVVFDGRDIVNGDENLPYPKKHLDPYTASPGPRNCPGDQETVVGAYDAWKRGMTHVQLGNNQNLCDKTYVGNVAHAILLASNRLSNPAVSDQVSGQIFFITKNDPRPFWDFMRSLWTEFDAIFPDRRQNAPAKKTVVLPRAFAFLLAYVMQLMTWLKGDKGQTFTPYTVTFATATMYFSSEKATRALGYEPQVGVDEGIERTMAWFKAESEVENFK
ncbi:hypothetical protein C8R44DRAFT_854921 [Mycena epipterygia]|nr:hypothetical protein C8R44DRAFT_854921 [Mycena epipterygia]